MSIRPVHLILVLAAVLAGACGDDGGAQGDAAVPDAGGNPAMPSLGVQIDRMGRPAINTALNNTFAEDTVRAAAEDAYNAASDRTTWLQRFREDFADGLGILDAIDGACGDQALAGPTPTADRYDTLAAALSDDQLLVNSAQGTCVQFLAVEAALLGVTFDDCGGRTLDYDVIDVTYSVLSIGALAGVTDGVSADDATHSQTTFPFVADPL